MSSGGEAVLELRAQTPTLSAPWKMIENLRSHRTLLGNMISRDFKVTYHGHVLGYVWSLLEPLLLTGIFYIVFVILRQSGDDLLPLNIMIGILMFNAFSRTLNGCTLCLIQNTSLIQQVYFPREILPTSVAGFQLVKLVLSILIVIPYMVYASITPTPLVILLPLAMVSAVMLAQGIGMMASMLHVRLRDTGQVIALLLRAAFFLSGVFYTAEHIPAEYLELHLSNPIAVFIEMGRAAVLGEMGPLRFDQIIRAMAVSVVTFIIGSMVFTKYERKAVKHL